MDGVNEIPAPESWIFNRKMPLNEADPNNLLMHVNRHLERIHAMSSLTINDLKQAILGDPVLKAALTGPAGASGDFIRNFGGSLLYNLNYEYESFDGFSSSSSIQTNGVVNGQNVIKLTGAKTSNSNFAFRPNTNRLYKVELFAKSSTDTTSIAFYPLDKNKVIINSGGNFSISALNVPISNNFSKYTGFVGGIGIGVKEFEPNTVFTTLSINPSNGTIFEYHSLVVNEVDLGEPVPFNLPFLPVGQMVFDSTDGSVGRYDGTTIHWFSIAV